MIFAYSYWESFCQLLYEKGVLSVPARKIMQEKLSGPYLVLKHDVETNVESAFYMAQIEHKWGHRGSYYVQAYLLENEKNVVLLKKMQDMGHEISYHHDVMDANAGDISSAINDFEMKYDLFEQNGFHIETVCQHGNPIVERNGYASNRDFFRNANVKSKFPYIADIMVDFKEKALGGTEYLYFSDAGRKFNLIFDPINNDINPSDNKNIPFDSLEDLWEYALVQCQNVIISTHPHRWVNSKIKYIAKTILFKVIRTIAKFFTKIPFLRKFMSRYYFIAKKF